MTTRLKLICHASTSAVRQAAFPVDEPLDPAGLKKLGLFGRHPLRADRSWTSPARRAVQTAEALGLSASVEPMLRDCDYGRWAGQSLADVEAQEPGALAEWMSDADSGPHGGESIRNLVDRAAAWLDAQLELPGQVVAVTHAAVIRAAVIHAIGATSRSFSRIDIAPLSLTKLSGTGGRWTLASIGPMQRAQS